MKVLIYSAFLDAIKDTLGIIPFLLLIFYAIELVEYFYSSKLVSMKFSKNAANRFGPLIGALLASIPQCGLSVIASTLYVKRFISKGTLIAVYLATSDEAIPVMLSNPGGVSTVLPLILIKVAIGLFAGYMTDLFLPVKEHPAEPAPDGDEKHIHDKNSVGACALELERGCHRHSIAKNTDADPVKSEITDILAHPIIHTLSITFFVFLVTFLINIVMAAFAGKGLEEILDIRYVPFKQFIQIALTSIFGIIPNCAVSVGITMMYIKGVISFASCVSGLCAGAGLGILVLIKQNKNKKDTFEIIILLLLISILSGLIVLVF